MRSIESLKAELAWLTTQIMTSMDPDMVVAYLAKHEQISTEIETRTK